jgi:N-acyl-D-amino-acid deacylase
MHDLVIRGGTIVDGSGGDPVDADLAIDGDTIVAVGSVGARGRAEIDAAGRIVTPGFIDLHTHLDGQVAWDPSVSPVSSHGVTTALMGNCSVTFAPVKPTDHSFLADMMESVEDIPSEIILDGMPWDWETYGEYLDSVERNQPVINVGGLVGHAAIRFYVLGPKSISTTREEEHRFTDDELARMVAVAEDSIRGGAFGLSLNRLSSHLLPDGRVIPGTWAPNAELAALARATDGLGGLVQLVPSMLDLDADRELIRVITQDAGARLLFSIFAEEGDQIDRDIEAMRSAGSRITAQTLPRSLGFLAGLNAVLPFRGSAWRAFSALELDAKLAFLADTEKRRILVDEVGSDEEVTKQAEKMWWLGNGDRPEYAGASSLADEARAVGRHPIEIFLDRCLESKGETLFHYRMGNYDLDGVLKHMNRDWVLPGLGDAGAHANQICDVGFATFYLSHWVRDQAAMPLAKAVAQLTSAPAAVLGVRDRGVLAEGMRADLNVIDFDRLAERQPRSVRDLPLGGLRLRQDAHGYAATVCNGVIINRDDELTGQSGGRTLRSQRR